MSGLFGYFDPGCDLPSETAERMAATMGCPVDRATVILRGASFAIGCVSKGVYPGEGELLTSQDHRRMCLFTGRLLGFTGEEESSDPVESARRVFLDNATPVCLRTANGPFAAAVWDEDRGRLEVITDRYGMYPIYVARHRSAVLFSGQIKALLAPGILPVEFDSVAVALTLFIGELVSDLTLIRGVRLLPAGSRVVFSSEGQHTTRYWQFGFRADETDFDGAAHRLADLLRTAVRRVCVESASVGVPLSGGLDSRVLLAATRDPTKVPSFTWGLAGCRDLRYAAAVARVVGSPHQGFEYDGGYLRQLATLGVWITEGQLPCTDFHVLPYVEKVGEQCSIVLNGYAGDAVLGGSFIKRAWWRASNRNQVGAALWRWRDISVGDPYRTGILGPALEGCDLADAQAAFIDCYKQTPGELSMDAAMAFLLDNHVRRYTSCGTSLLRWRVESDQPFFDNDFLDLVLRTPHAWRFRHQLYLHMLRTCFPEVAEVRWQRTGLRAGAPRWLLYVSLGIHRLNRYKLLQPLFRSRQVSSFDGWIRGPLRNYVTGLLNDPRTLDRGLCDPDTLRRAVQDHVDSGLNNSTLLGSLMALELFARLFVDRDMELIERCRISAPSAHVVNLGTVT